MQATNKTGPFLQRLRHLMKNSNQLNETIHAYIVPSGDAHQNEYIAAHDKRRAFISGFTGSSGTAVITEDKAALWTDGRYFLQASQELDENWILIKDDVSNSITQGIWLNSNLPSGSRIGVDPFIISADFWDKLTTELEVNNQSLVAITPNLIDLIWDKRPLPQRNPVEPYLFGSEGEKYEQKLAKVRTKMSDNQAEILVMSALDDIAWLFNLRGTDIEYNPVFFSYALITIDSVHLFVDVSKLTGTAKAHLLFPDSSVSVRLHKYEEFVDIFTEMIKNSSSKIWVSKFSSYGIRKLIPQERQFIQSHPVAMLKAVKTSAEIEGMKLANEYDAVALCQYFAWLEKEVPKGNITEIAAATKLEEFRKERESFKGLSFETISASGLSGSIIHYKPTPETDRNITLEELYLCDSGGQFLEGTTDITRTVHFGTPTEYEKECFTLVLKGHIALMTINFPEFTRGNMLDSFARQALWNVGLDYLHGTGHGIGAYLNVHETPPGISQRLNVNDFGLEEGMILSDEPGYYEDNKFGIRIESAVLVAAADIKYKIKPFLKLVPITFVPIQTKMVNSSLLTAKEIEWINDYHLQCREIVGNRLKSEGKMEIYEWLVKETQPLD